MAIIAREPEGKNFTPAPEGIHVAACCDVVDLGMADHGFGEKHYVELRFQLEDADEAGRRFLVRRRYTLSLGEKATLRKDLETWRGRKFNKQELAGFDLERLIGIGAQVQVVHRLTDQGYVRAPELTHEAHDSLSSPLLPGFQMPLTDLFT